MLDKSNLLNEQLIDPNAIMRTKEKIKYKLTVKLYILLKFLNLLQEEGFVEENFIK